MMIHAFDLSLTATGYAGPLRSCALVPPKGMKDLARLAWIRDQVLTLARGAALVVLEGYGFAPGRGHAAREMGELGGVVRLALFEAGLAYVDVPPASLKKYAAGKGNADKAAVLVAAVKRLGYEGSDHNVADALWLREMALGYYGEPGAVFVPQAQSDALEGVTWPAPARRAALAGRG